MSRELAEDTYSVAVDTARLGGLDVLDCQTLADDDPYGRNTMSDPDRVHPRTNSTARPADDGVPTVELPPVSWTAVSLAAS